MNYAEYEAGYPGGKEAIISRCRLYGMDDEVPHKARITIIALIILLAFVGLAVTAGVLGNEGLVYLSIFGGIIFIFGYIVKRAQFDTMKRFTKIMRDETGCCYKMKFTGGCNIIMQTEVNSPAAVLPVVGAAMQVAAEFKAMEEKDKILNDLALESAEIRTAYYYLKRYKMGLRDWDVMNGGECRITPLGYLTKIGKNKYRAQYMGKISTVKIPAYINYKDE